MLLRGLTPFVTRCASVGRAVWTASLGAALALACLATASAAAPAPWLLEGVHLRPDVSQQSATAPTTASTRAAAKAATTRVESRGTASDASKATAARRSSPPKNGSAGKARPAKAKPSATRAKARTTARRRSNATTRRAVAPVPVLRHTTPRGEIALAADLHALLNAGTRSGAWGVVVASVSRGDTLFTRNGDAPMLPASTLKLFTTALAFERLGPNHQLTTEILRDGAVEADGTLHGSLFLRGGGDPSLSPRYMRGGPDAPMRTLARMVADAGITRVTGDVVGDASAFDGKRIPDGWLSRYLHDAYASRVSPLSLNENLLNVVIAPGRSGQAGAVSLQPATVAYKVVNNTRTVRGSRAARLVVSRTSDGTIVARGTIGTLAGSRTYQVVVDDPAIFTAGAFRRALEAEGIAVDGELRLGVAPPSAPRVGFFRSPPLWTLANDMNRESVNHIAELLFRDAARPGSPDGVGSAERANALLRDFLSRKVGVRPEAVSAADGSGLSSLNRVTPRSLVQLLGYAHRAPWGHEFHQSLPVAGRTDMLRGRMTATPAQGNLHAKTGTTSEVIALGGYVHAQNGELLAFSFLYNGADRWKARETIDAMGATLASWAR
jgi:serine-type D-Ala-D-Ala carboxypeptidase/endopeptidase (penicillin-binding protein 4)